MTSPADFEEMGRDHGYRGLPPNPSLEFVDPNDPRVAAYLTGYDDARDDVARKGQ